jgi:phosphate-selective porin OprO/OprP
MLKRELWSVALLGLAGGAWADFDPEAEFGPLRFDLGGRFMSDFLLDSSAPANDQNDFEVRRARLKIKVDYVDDWNLKGSVDFPNGETSTRDLSLSYTGWPVHLEIGRMQEPFGMIEAESSKYLALMERPLASGLAADYSLGVTANVRGERWVLTVGAFSPVTESLDLADDDDDEALDARLNWTPLRRNLAFIHLGAGVSWRWPASDTLRFSLRPETTLVNDLAVNHPRLRDVSRYRLTGLEFAWRAESVLLQSEYFRADIRRSAHTGAVFDGYYVQLSWAITGERRGYSTRRGAFGSPKPDHSVFQGGFGAFEVALRFSEADLRDTGVRGDTGDTLAAGINWYPSENLRTSINYVRITENEFDRRNREDLWQGRLQFHF